MLFCTTCTAQISWDSDTTQWDYIEDPYSIGSYSITSGNVYEFTPTIMYDTIYTDVLCKIEESNLLEIRSVLTERELYHYQRTEGMFLTGEYEWIPIGIKYLESTEGCYSLTKIE